MSCNCPISFFRFDDGETKIMPSGTKEYDYKGRVYTPSLVPCGKCIGCRLDYARSWTFRLMCELQYHEKSSFITLTYDNAHVRFSDSHADHLTLCKKDLQKFFKRLRKKYPNNDIRYYAVGEYGPQTFRPHYHMIIFGYLPDDLEFYKINHQGDILYSSSELSKLWPFGFNTVGVATSLTAGYCARYVTEKQIGISAISSYDEFGIERPFAIMSRRPAIGLRWFQDHIDDIVKYKKLTVATPDGALTISPPKYFFDKLVLTNPEDYCLIMMNHECDGLCLSSLPSYTDLTDEHDNELMRHREFVVEQKLKALKRGEI